jgi:DNA-binding transcriptional LysR family regulator
MEIAQLEAFVRIVTEGSITRAGIALQRNQSSISMRLAALEHSLGTMLFERSGRRLVLTAAGRAFLPYAEKILELRAESERETQFAARSSTGEVVSLGANNWSAAAILPRLATAFHARERNCALMVEVHSTPTLVSLLGESRVRLALLNPQLATRVFHQLARYEEPCVLVSKDPFDRELSAGEVAELPFLSYTAGPVRDLVIRLQFQVGRELPTRAWSNSAQLIRSLVDSGLGIGFLPFSVVEEDLRTGRLHRITVRDFTAAPWPVSLVAMRGRRLTAPDRTFVDMAVALLRDLQDRTRATLAVR